MNKDDARTLANELMEAHGLKQPEDGGKPWFFKFDAGKKRFGRCNYGDRIISLSLYLTRLNTEERVRNTILHEIAHALAGWQAGHGWQWKATARLIGCDGMARYNAEEVNRPETSVYANCPNCGKESGFYRMPKREKACGDCCQKYNGGKYTERFRFEYKRR